VHGGGGSSSGFTAGIYFPHDGVIDSSSYARSLIDKVVGSGRGILVEDCPPVVKVRWWW